MIRNTCAYLRKAAISLAYHAAALGFNGARVSFLGLYYAQEKEEWLNINIINLLERIPSLCRIIIALWFGWHLVFWMVPQLDSLSLQQIEDPPSY
jgi:hypothetical protein